MANLEVRHGTHTARFPFEGAPVLADLLQSNGLTVHTPCGGKGVCGKCAVHAEGALSAPTAKELESFTPAQLVAGMRLACQARLTGDALVTLTDAAALTNIQLESALPAFTHHPMRGKYGLAVDIGTTTLALRLVDLANGTTLTAATAANPQGNIAADVIGRIEVALDGKGAELQRLVAGAMETLIASLCQRDGISPDNIASIVIAGNTTMLYLLTNRSPASLAHAPFDADCLFDLWVKGKDIHLHSVAGAAIYLPACPSAFVGADITCGVLASRMYELQETALLVDLGTNGEIALWHEGTMYCSATAAGPAFEGVNISKGVGSVPGAIDRVWIENGAISYTTLGGQSPIGICGSGLLDAVAVLLELGIVDETGLMEDGEAVIGGDIALTQKDIRSVQLAKGAIAAGIKTICKHVGIAESQIARLYIAGGFGSHVSIANAAAIGLIPAVLADKAAVLGNASLTGTEMMLFNQEYIDTAAQIANTAVSVPLGGSAVFAEYYMDCMLFTQTEPS